MNILVLASDIPATSSMPGSPRLFNLARELSKNHQISLFAISRSERRYELFLKNPDVVRVFPQITILPKAPHPTWWNQQRHRFQLASHLLTKYRYPEYYREMCNLIIEKIRQDPSLNLVYADGLEMTQYLDTNLKIPAVVDLHDSNTLLFQRITKIEKRVLRKLAFYLEMKALSKWEKSLGKSFSLIITNSRIDESVIKKLAPSTQTLTVANGVDTEYFSASCTTTAFERLVFTGVMSYGPNEDAVLYFCREIFPLIREQFPAVEFWAVGEDPSSKLKSLSQQPGVYVSGTVDDVRPYLQSAGLFVSPIRYGSGIKNKLLAAMAMYKPIVATPISVDGIDARPDYHILIADNPQDFAAKVVGLFNDQDLARRLSGNAYQLVREKYSWKAIAQSLESAIEKLVD